VVHGESLSSPTLIVCKAFNSPAAFCSVNSLQKKKTATMKNENDLRWHDHLGGVVKVN
jgi:hypothetical protein